MGGSESLLGLRMLDIGCGGGLLAEPLAARRTHCIDASQEAIGAKAHAKSGD